MVFHLTQCLPFFLFKPFSLKHSCFKFSRLKIWQPKTQITSDVLSRLWSTALVLHFKLSAACSGLRVKSLRINSLSALQCRNTHCINGVYYQALHSNLFCVLLIRLPGFLAILSLKWFLVEQVLWNRSAIAFSPVFTGLLLKAKRKNWKVYQCFCPSDIFVLYFKIKCTSLIWHFLKNLL